MFAYCRIASEFVYVVRNLLAFLGNVSIVTKLPRPGLDEPSRCKDDDCEITDKFAVHRKDFSTERRRTGVHISNRICNQTYEKLG